MQKISKSNSFLKICTHMLMLIVVCASAVAGLKVWEKKNEVHIPIAMAMDSNYLYPTMVAITSAMENAKRTTVYDFYIMHPGEFKAKDKEKIKTLEKKYKKCHINLIDMGNQFKNANDKGHITTPAYYRLALSDLLPDIDKIIWLDGDTLTFDDLREMYNLDMNGYYYKGYLDESVHMADSFGVVDDHYICSGVMLVNLKELRENNMVSKFNEFIEKNNSKLIQHDQSVINVMCYEKIGKLPPRYGMFNYYANMEEAKKYPEALIAKDKYTPDEMADGFENMCILHCVCKPWKSTKYIGFHEWWSYARKTDFYEEIHARYPIF